MTEHVVISKADGVLEIRFNRPDKKNALSAEMYESVAAALDGANDDRAIRAVLLTGTGDTFTSGNDVRNFQARSVSNAPSASGRFLPALTTFRKPLIGAVNGAAIGIGTTMLLHCDLIVAATNARFHMPFTPLGLVPEAGSSLLVPQAIGHRRASALLLLGDAIDAATALDWGLINQVVAPDALMPTARALAARLAALPSESVRQTKALMRGDNPGMQARIAEELLLLRERVRSPEAKEAFAAFVEKRKPDFSGFH